LKFSIFIIFIFVCSGVIAEQIKDISPPKIQTQELEDKKQKLEVKILNLNKEFEELIKIQSKLIANIKDNLKVQQKIGISTEEFLSSAQESQDQSSFLKIHLLQPTDFYIFALPLVTIFIVIGGTFLSLRTIKIKSQESLDALDNSNENQLNISKLNNESESKKSRESIISTSRQRWINSLRDQIASLASHQTQYSVSNRQPEIFAKMWEEMFTIELLLNPKEKLHNELLLELGLGFRLCSIIENHDKYKHQRMVILAKSKEILKVEWNRVKSFE
jgi:predicted PurR-regulated permease PerM